MQRQTIQRPKFRPTVKFIVCSALLLITKSLPALGQTINLGPIQPSDLRVDLVPFGSIPNADRMSYLHHAGDGSGRVFLSTQNGQVWEFDAEGTRNPMPFLDLTTALPGQFKYVDIVSNGLRGFAFHPQFNQSDAPGYGKFYTSHSEFFQSAGPSGADFPLDPNWILNDGRPDSRNDSVVAEWQLDPESGHIDSSSYRSVIRVEQPFFDHPICQIAFNPTAAPSDADFGNLYVGFGDGGGSWSGAPDFDRNLVGQDTSNLLSTIIRINPLAASGSNYSVPSDNPFVGAPGLDEIYAYGFRHPQTFSFDTVTGKLLVGEIGEDNIEQIELVEAGTNHGWGVREGTYSFDDAALPPNGSRNDEALTLVPLETRQSDAFTYPVAQYDHLNVNPSGGDAIAAGFVYRGTLAPSLQDMYVFGNFSTDNVFVVPIDDLTNDQEPAEFHELGFRFDGQIATLGQVLGNNRSDMRFGQDENGEIYLLNKRNGIIYRLEELEPAGPPNGIVGDVNQDGFLNGDGTGLPEHDDISAFVAGFWSTGHANNFERYTHGDLNLDGITNIVDWHLLRGSYIVEFGSAPDPFSMDQHVPEPGGALLLLSGVGGLLIWRSRVGRCRRKLNACESSYDPIQVGTFTWHGRGGTDRFEI